MFAQSRDFGFDFLEVLNAEPEQESCSCCDLGVLQQQKSNAGITER